MLALLRTTSRAQRYWNMARQRYSHQSAPCHRATPVSVDRAASPTPHARGKSPASRRGRAKSRETRTVCWRERDSNRRSLSGEGGAPPAEREWCRRRIKPSRKRPSNLQGTESSNPVPSASESVSPVNFAVAGGAHMSLSRSAGGRSSSDRRASADWRALRRLGAATLRSSDDPRLDDAIRDAQRGGAGRGGAAQHVAGNGADARDRSEHRVWLVVDGFRWKSMTPPAFAR